jgi:uncharacterized protein
MASGEDGSLILYNSMSGSIASVRKEKSHIIRSILRNGINDDELLGKELARGGFLVSEEVDETNRLKALYYKRYQNNNHLHLILMSTEQCNFRCVYCYEKFLRGKMPQEIQNGVFNYVKRRINHLDSISVEWFGGEPLLASDVVLGLGERLFHLAKEHNIPFTSSVTTNGYYLTRDLVQKLLSIGIDHYTVTLDGIDKEHDKRRVLREGGGTFSTIIGNLKDLKSTDWNFKVKFRNNYDPESLEKIDEFLLYLKKNFGNDVRFADINMRPIGKWGGPNDSTLQVCESADSSIRWAVLRKAMQNGFPENDLKYYLQPGKYVCYASDPMSFAIGAAGQIMKCTLELDTNERNIIGQVKEDGFWEIDYEKLALWVLGDGNGDTGCKNCYFAPACQGAACAKARFDTGHSPCPSEKKDISKVLRLIHEQDVILNCYPSKSFD